MRDGLPSVLPSLVGSDKQVAWAVDIRRQAIDLWTTRWMPLALEQYRRTAQQEREDVRGDDTSYAEQAELDLAMIEGMTDFMRAQDDASWWINHRGMLITTPSPQPIFWTGGARHQAANLLLLWRGANGEKGIYQNHGTAVAVPSREAA